jgi:amino acid transporter
MFGTGVLINTVNLSKKAGALGFVSYSIVAFLMLPLIFAIAEVVKLFPTGGFYTYGKSLGTFWGFFSGWCYFTGKLASASLLIHIFSTLLQTIIPTFASIPTLIVDTAILVFFTWLNQFNLKTGTTITYTFIIMKCIPVLFVIVSSLYLWQTWSLPAHTFMWSGIPGTIPLVLYAFVGFEAACSISTLIENPEKNAPKAILYSFAMVIGITLLYQFTAFAAIGNQLMTAHSFLDTFPLMFGAVIPSSTLIKTHVLNSMYIAAACAALGGSYGILLSNAWNLKILADNNHIWYSTIFSRLNTYGVPFGSVVVEALLCLFYFLITFGHQTTLQQISVFGCTISYTLSVIALLTTHKHPILASLGLGSCAILLAMCVRNFMINESLIVIVFGSIVLFGCSMYVTKQLSRA